MRVEPVAVELSVPVEQFKPIEEVVPIEQPNESATQLQKMHNESSKCCMLTPKKEEWCVAKGRKNE